MTTYTMNGHKHSMKELQPEILMGIVGNRIAQFARAHWRLRVFPEKFRCLESADPEAQLQAALKQIETLLYKNAQLLETVLLLSQALNGTHSIIRSDQASGRPIRGKLRLPHESNGHT